MAEPKARRYTPLPTDLESALDMIERLLDEQKRAARMRFEAERAQEAYLAMVEDARAALNAIEAPAGTLVRHPLNYAKVLAEENVDGRA